MSEVLSRPSAPRGRGSARGGRGGYSSRGGRVATRTTKVESPETSYEDEGEIGQLKKKYASDLPTLQELFPDWTTEDLVFALEDANGDLENVIEHITEGMMDNSFSIFMVNFFFLNTFLIRFFQPTDKLIFLPRERISVG
jgi:hypothetical protein